MAETNPLAGLRERLKSFKRPESADGPAAASGLGTAAAPAPVAAPAPTAAPADGAMGLAASQGLLRQLEGASPGEWDAMLRDAVGGSVAAWVSFLRHAEMHAAKSMLLKLSDCATSSLRKPANRESEPYIQLCLQHANWQLQLSGPADAKQTLELMRHEGIGRKHAGYYIAMARVEMKKGKPGKAEKSLRDGMVKCPVESNAGLREAWESILGVPFSLDAPAAEEEQTATVQVSRRATAAAAAAAEDDGTATICVPGASFGESAGDPTIMMSSRRGAGAGGTKKKPTRRLGSAGSRSAARIDITDDIGKALAESALEAALPSPVPEPDAPSPTLGAPDAPSPTLDRISEANSSMEASSVEATPRPTHANDAAGTFKIGDPVKVFSRSLVKWFDGKVLGLLGADDPDNGGVKGDVKVIYGEGITKCVDPTDRESLIHRGPVAPPKSCMKPAPVLALAVQPEEFTQEAAAQLELSESSDEEHDTVLEEPVEERAPKASLTERIAALETPCRETKELVVFSSGRTYKKLGLYGRGGSCKVFKVIDEKGEISALKRVKEPSFQGNDSAYEPFINEIELLQKLNNEKVTNPNIITLHDAAVCRNSGAVYMVFEPGEIDLHKLLQKNEGQQSFKDNYIRLYWQQMLEAVNTIHKERIVHSDLKPANFLMVAGTLKLIDFGIAKGIESNDTTNIVRDTQVGTMNYMSPEALAPPETDNEFKLSRKSDIWSLGCILYQMVYGKTPFHHLRNMMQKIRAITDPTHEIKFDDIPDKMLLETMKSCFNRDYKTRPGIPELLKHSYVTGASAGGCVPAAPVGMNNADLQAILQKVASGDVDASDLLRQLNAGATTEDLSEVIKKQPAQNAKAAVPGAPMLPPPARKKPTAAPAAPVMRAALVAAERQPAVADHLSQIAQGKSGLRKAADRPALKVVANENSAEPESLRERLAKFRQAAGHEETSEVTTTNDDEWA